MSDKDELREHSFDGIQEYDNDLPSWWLWLFYITIAISVIYPFIYDFGPGEFASETVDKEMLAYAEKNKSQNITAPAVTDDYLISLAKNSEALQKGQSIYTAKCFACHADKGAGLVGPNLADDYWIHGGKITDVHRIVSEGVLEKGMLAWKSQMTPEELNQVVAFVWSLRGSNPPNAKAPQGELVPR